VDRAITPRRSPERVDRLVQKGLVKKKRGALRPTLKGRLLALWAADK
jgi:hypothetical protein